MARTSSSEDKVGAVAYSLELPASRHVHLMLHVSLLKPSHTDFHEGRDQPSPGDQLCVRQAKDGRCLVAVTLSHRKSMYTLSNTGQTEAINSRPCLLASEAFIALDP
jgi:hypothetical protein